MRKILFLLVLAALAPAMTAAQDKTADAAPVC